ncbi:non-ribosomal peptide synthetase [Paenibacillus sp. IHBB 10380]|uniref:non-ribosomal peptide synthetase n=1 Tax=Paenibacillus sp. IHBB 10380 TaxID=1566358 RepID=UPI001F25B59F|nr:non-ribosomal peptide synthetase [Paenibacillus sp. IHBB 10380]
MFVNTLALRNRPQGEKTFVSYLEDVKTQVLQAYENQEYPLEELVEKLGVRRDLSRNPLFDTLFALQNMEMKEFGLEGLKVSPYGYEGKIAKFDVSVQAVEGEGKLYFHVEYGSRLFRPETMERWSSHWLRLLEQVADQPEIKLSDIELMTEEEREQVLVSFNETEAPYPREKTISELFEEQVAKTPKQVAVVYEGEEWTYEELNARSNQVARVLRKHGVGNETIVGIMVERSLEMMAGILGILKAGGAYLPIDPDYPAERIAYMLEDSGTKVLLTQKRLTDRVVFDGSIVALDEAGVYAEEERGNIAGEHTAASLAYVIYTSGSTGKPKGVLVEQRNVVRLVKNTNYVEFGEGDRILQTGALVFDASTFEIWGALLNGLRLYLSAEHRILDPQHLGQSIEQYGITTMWLTASLFNQVVQERIETFRGLKTLIVGGEALSVEHVNRVREAHGELKIVNGYGPTENTTFSASYVIDGKQGGTIPIGKAINHSKVYVLDGANRLQPIGIAGELCVAGDGLARGYLNRPELTEEKFVENPFVPGERMYRTGDLARWLPDGNLEYLGRIDEQVKIRGFRIEPDEVRQQLMKHEAVEDAVVVSRKGEEGEAYLCAYVVTEEELPVSAWRKHMGESLPEYMIPSYFVRLEKLPLTPNGKVDRKALPAPEGAVHTGVEYVAPRNDMEAKLANVWSEVLGLEHIGVRDNFFELGGDSIKAIQISARLHKQQLKLEIANLFLHPTIEDVSLYVRQVEMSIDQGQVKGQVELTPIQRWFFEQDFQAKHHWNQSVMVYRQEGFNSEALREVLQELVAHHDALRMRYEGEGDSILQVNEGIEGNGIELSVVEIVGDEEEVARRIESESECLQSRLNLQSGPLMRAGLFKTSEGDHLLLAVHHLVIDGVSWRILLEDLALGYEQRLANEEVSLPEKTNSYQQWSKELNEYANSRKLLREKPYWKAVEEAEIARLPKDMEAKAQGNTWGESRIEIVEFTEEETEKLLRNVHQAYHTEMNDILLTGLTQAVEEWTGEERVGLTLEGHGREEVIKGVNVNRTVGWFTSMYPVVLEIKGREELGNQIKQVKETLRRIPNKGIGYGILKYVTEKEKTQELEFKQRPEISFNYLGQFDAEMESGVLEGSGMPMGSAFHRDSERAHKLDVGGAIMGGKLQMSIQYPGSEYREETIKGLLESYRDHLRRIIEHCVQKEDTERTPSDFSAKALSLGSLELIYSMVEEME